MFGEESYSLYLSMPKEILLKDVLQSRNIKIGKALCAYVKVGMSLEEKEKYDSALIKMVEEWKK